MAIFLLQNGIPLNDLFFEHKKPHEKFGIATFNKKVLSVNYPDIFTIIDEFIPTWFRVGLNETRDLHQTGWEEYRSFYTKLVLLSDAYLKNNKTFEDLMCVNYNTEYNNWEVHPGQGRKVAYLLFGDDNIDCITFDLTGQQDIKFKEFFNTNKELQDYCLSHYNKEAFIPIHPRNGTYIPQLYFDGTKYNFDLEILFRKLQQFWNTHSLKHNIPLFQEKLKHNISNNNTVDIEINNTDDFESLCRAMVLAPKLTSNYQDEYMSINISKKFNV